VPVNVRKFKEGKRDGGAGSSAGEAIVDNQCRTRARGPRTASSISRLLTERESEGIMSHGTEEGQASLIGKGHEMFPVGGPKIVREKNGKS